MLGTRSKEDKERDIVFNQIRHYVAIRCNSPPHLSLKDLEGILKMLQIGEV